MKHARILISALMSLLIIGQQSQAALVILDRIIAVVDEDVVMESQLNQRLSSIKAQLTESQRGQIPSDEELRAQIIERLVVESVQLQMAKRAGVRISDEELNESMTAIAAQNNLNLQQFRQAVESDGIPYEEMRDQIRREVKINRVQQGVMRSRINISEQEIKDFLASELGEVITADEYRLAHILLPFPEDATPAQINEVMSSAEGILEKINGGADFKSLAIEKSTGQNALNGGDLGWRKVIQLPTMFADITQEMETGELRGPIKSGSGFHLIKLLEKRGAKAEGQVAQAHVKHVLIQPSEIRTHQEALELSESLRQEIADGRDFDEIAKLFSDDPGSALSGGDLGWNRAGTFVPIFEQQMKDSEINQLSKVFESEHGFHFLEVTGRRIEDFSERFKEGQAENYLRNQKFDEELENWIRELREDAFVEIRE
jgi:peptidyl-prolyl cis-trans isomerase SurA